MQQTTSLSKPVGSIMRPVPRVWTSASVAAAAAEIRDSGLPAVAVTEGFLYVAVVTQSSLAAAQARGVGSEDSVELVYDSHAVTLPPYAPGEKALEIFTTQPVTAIPVVDDYGRLMGVLTPADLWPKRDRAPRPAAVGGMATPFGVYLTTGTFGAGANGLALMSTGALMFTVLSAAEYGVEAVQDYGTKHAWHVPDFVFGVLATAVFMAAFRLLPLAGIHAAEHKVVHAIERGEDLTRENVRRMPRVHPRCGTNFAVGASILLGIATNKALINDDSTRVIVALLTTLIFWRPLGSLVQYWVTTKEPTDAQVDMGIRSGNELLKQYASGRSGSRNIASRIWNSGMLHVMGGASVVFAILALFAWIFFHVNMLAS